MYEGRLNLESARPAGRGERAGALAFCTNLRLFHRLCNNDPWRDSVPARTCKAKPLPGHGFEHRRRIYSHAIRRQLFYYFTRVDLHGLRRSNPSAAHVDDPDSLWNIDP